MGIWTVVGFAGVAAGGALVCWLAAPLVSLVHRGTIDQRTVQSWREEARTEASRRAAAREQDAHGAIPLPRRTETTSWRPAAAC